VRYALGALRSATKTLSHEENLLDRINWVIELLELLGYWVTWVIGLLGLLSYWVIGFIELLGLLGFVGWEAGRLGCQEALKLKPFRQDLQDHHDSKIQKFKNSRFRKSKVKDCLTGFT
jgi:hypothetical protein